MSVNRGADVPADPIPVYPVSSADTASAEHGQTTDAAERAASGALRGVRVAVLNFREPAQSAAGGAEQYAWQVGRHLVAEGASVHFLTAREPGQRRVEIRDGITLLRMGNRFTVYPLVWLWLLLHRRRFDAVIDSMNGVPFFSPLAVRRRTAVICLVHHVHARQFYAFFPRWLARIGCFIEGPIARLVYRRVMTVTVSESSRRELRERLRWTAPIRIVHNGSPAARAVPEPAEDVGDPALVYVGRLVGHKRVERVVDLAESLAPAWPGLRVHIVGQGPEHARLVEQTDARGLADRVRVHGFLPERDKDALLGGAMLNVTASEFEGWGLTVIEAAALGVPTVAYDVAGLRDSVRHGVTGWLVREGETLAEVVDRALRELADPVRRARVQQACRSWAAEFTWGRTGAAMTELIIAELDARGRRTPVLRPGGLDGGREFR
nr:glycosyltransferase family 4 protein [Thermostaphylospora chromogena]